MLQSYAPDTDEDENPTVLQLHVRKGSQQSGSQTGNYQESMDRTSQACRTSSLMPADERSRGAGTQPILISGVV